MPSTTKDQRKGSKPPKHWTQNVQDSAVSRAADGRLHFALKGGAENGQFVYISDIKQDKIIIRSGKLHVEEIILEINGTKVAGFTLWDIHILLRDFRDQLLHLKTVKAGQPLTKDLRRYLNTRFQKDSIDHELQQTIRGNLYYRTVPCTTRPPREGEIDGVDYKFLSVNEFMALEKSGHLLESGIFDGNHYGTPKPPKEPPPESPPQSPPHSPMDDGPHLPVEDINETQNDSRSIIRPGATPSSAGKRQRNKSNIDATTLNSKPVDDEEEERRLKIQQLEDKYGVLPSNWEISFTEDGDLYYIDHEREITQWNDPRDDSKEAEEDNSSKKSEEGSESKELPYGWERIDDPQYGTYYIDHVNRKTQYESPLKDIKENGEKGSKEVSEKIEASKEAVEESAKRPENGGVLTTSEKDWHHLFTDDPDKLEGQRLKTSLFKSRQGFGFTIIGGDEADEFLQIKSILPDGPAFEDGKLKTGDVLIFVNDKKVLGSTHQDVVSLFQTITPGEKVTLEVCRGYPLPFDPSDPNTNNVTTYGRSGSMENFRNHHNGSDGDSPSYHGPGDTRRHGPRKRKDDNHLKNSNAKSLPDLTRQVQTDIDHRAKTPTPSMNLHYPDNGSTPHFAKPETIVVEFEKGPDGFGFTVADSPYGQKIKQLFVPQRSQGLQEEDILVEINNRNIQSLPHKEVVNCLKDCPQGAKARIVVLRGAGKLMFQQIPLLEIDGLCLAESTAQANYLGLKYNMLGGTDKEKARVQMLFSGAKSFFTSCTPSWNFYAPERKEEMVKAAINSAKSRYLPAFEKALEDNGTSFLVGSSPTIADCALYDILTYFEMPEYGDLLADSPLCKAFLTKFASIPGVKEYLNSPRRFPPPDVELVEWVKATLYL